MGYREGAGGEQEATGEEESLTPTPKNPLKWFKNDISLGKHGAETPMGVANRPHHISQMASKQYYTAYS